MYLKLATKLLGRASVFLLLVFAFLVSSSSGQGKPAIKVSIELSSETARGGESISYNITVTNVGAVKADNIILINETGGVVKELVISATTGTCEVTDRGVRPNLRCELGEVGPQESARITVEARLTDLDGATDAPDEPIVSGIGTDYVGPVNASGTGSLPDTTSNIRQSNPKDSVPKSLLGEVRAYAVGTDDGRADDSVDVKVILYPSRNRPPKVQIVSPRSDATLNKPLGRQIKIPIIIKATDQDGYVRKVKVSSIYNPYVNFLDDDGKLKMLIDGKKYTREDLEELQAKFYKDLSDGSLKELPRDDDFMLATATDKDTFQLSLGEIGYGRNLIRVCGEDNGGRITCDSVDFNITGDSRINIQAPAVEVVSPGTTVTVETLSEVGIGVKPKVLLHGLNGQYLDENAPQMTQVARDGNTYTHRYVWKPREEGYYTFRAVLFENGVDTNTQSQKGLLVAEPRVIKILSLADGQDCTESKPCSVSVSELDVKGNAVRDKLEVIVDGKLFSTIHSLECEGCEPRSLYLRFPHFAKGRHSLQIIARHESEIELARSEIYTFTIK